MSRIFTSTILFNKSINSGGAAFMEEKRSQDNIEASSTESTETTKSDFDPKALFDSYMSEFKEENSPNKQTTEPSDKWSPLNSFHAYLDALEKETDLYPIVIDGIKELRERVHFKENEYKDYDNEGFSLTAYDISLKKSEHYPENTYSASSKFDILYILLNWMQEAGVRGDCSYNEAYPLTVIQNEDISFIWSIMIFKDGTLKECNIGDGRDKEETSINYRSIEDIQIEIADKPFQFSNYKSIVNTVKSSSDESEDNPFSEEVARRVKEVENLLRKNGSLGSENSMDEKPYFPHLTAEAIKFIDEVCVEKGIHANSSVDDVEEIWDGLLWDFGVVDNCNSDEEREKIAKAFTDYMAYKRTQF